MAIRQGQTALLRLIFSTILAVCAIPALAAPYAAMVMDARSGEVLHSRNADTRLHPASLTKMMTLYIAFEAVERGEIGIDQKVLISKKAAAEPPSKLGLKSGQRIAFRYLIRAAAIKSANDAATAIGEALEGSEAAFARRMNRTAKALGMTRTTFKNAHGLTEAGHLSTARDMTIMGRRLFYDYPQYYNIFSRRSTHAGIREVANTNRRLLAAYRGADGIKTGFTNAAGFNLVASAERGQERIIATVFGGRSTASRNARVAELLDMGFQRAPSRAAIRRPAPPLYPSDHHSNRPSYSVTAVMRSPRPLPRPAATVVATASATETATDLQVQISETLALVDIESAEQTPPIEIKAQAVSRDATVSVARPASAVAPAAVGPTSPAEEQIVTRLSTSGGRHFGINVGRFGSRHQAERVLLQTALLELGTLDEALRKVVERSGGYDANFVGLSEDQAALACRRLEARNVDCATIGPGSAPRHSSRAQAPLPARCIGKGVETAFPAGHEEPLPGSRHPFWLVKRGGHKLASVGVPRRVENLGGQAFFHHVAALHDHHAVRQGAHDLQVVADEDVGQTVSRLQFAQKLDDLNLHGHIQCTRRLVQNHQPRP